MFQVDTTRFILVYVIQGILVIYFSILAYQVIKRKRQRLNLMFSGFFICMIIGNIVNMIYASINNETIILILNFLTNFFICFGTVFILIVHRMILESTIIFSIKQQNRYILRYGFLLFFGMLLLILFELLFGIPLGVEIDRETGNPIWTPIFYIYVISILTGFSISPIIRTSFKIYHSLENEILRRKWFWYLIGSLGLIGVLYMFLTDVLIGHLIPLFRLIVTVYGITVILWGYLMYYGIGFKLKQ